MSGSREVLELQSSIIEWQRYVIGELMERYSKEPGFEMPEELQEKIQEVNRMYRKINTL